MPILEAAKLFVKACSTCLKLPNATSINTLGSLFPPDFYIEAAETYKAYSEIPLMNLIFFGIYSKDNGKTWCVYTYGMNAFGKKDIEILDSSHSLQEVLDFMTDIADYVITGDVTLISGETIGTTAEQKLTIIESPSQVLTESTLKIGF